MTNQTSGSVQSSNKGVADRLVAFENELNHYSATLGLNFIRHNTDVNRAFELSEADIKALDAIGCGELSLMLSNYALYIQKEVNRVIAKRNWAKANIDMLMAQHSKDFSQYMKYEEKINSLCNTNSAALELNKIYVGLTAKFDELNKMAERLDSMAYRLDELQKSKRKIS
jgi:DNA repair ATPase RecN